MPSSSNWIRIPRYERGDLQIRLLPGAQWLWGQHPVGFHKPDRVGAAPTGATDGAASNGRVPVLQTGDVGSILSAPTMAP